MLSAALTLTAAVGAAAQTPAGYGPNPDLPPPDTAHRTARFVRGVGWPAGAAPQAGPGFRVAQFADQLQNPRWLYLLPNGDVLVAESANPGAASDTALTPEASRVLSAVSISACHSVVGSMSSCATNAAIWYGHKAVLRACTLLLISERCVMNTRKYLLARRKAKVPEVLRQTGPARLNRLMGER